MSLCAACGAVLVGSSELCRHHDMVEDGWGQGNGKLCDLLHRGKELDRVPKDFREELVDPS